MIERRLERPARFLNERPVWSAASSNANSENGRQRNDCFRDEAAGSRHSLRPVHHELRLRSRATRGGCSNAQALPCVPERRTMRT
jgi:hypothetical protein